MTYADRPPGRPEAPTASQRETSERVPWGIAEALVAFVAVFFAAYLGFVLVVSIMETAGAASETIRAVTFPLTQVVLLLGILGLVFARHRRGVALLFGRRAGATAGGLGSAMADLLGGYPHWAPFTLIIKGIEGYVVGALGASRPNGRPRRMPPEQLSSYTTTAWRREPLCSAFPWAPG